MNTYSQNKEDLIVKAYFGDRIGTLLSVGENDGMTFSNALLLIQNKWSAHLFEPSSVCNDLLRLHRANPNVSVYNKGLGDKTELVRFYESGAHVKNGTDKALVSTTDPKEAAKWRKKGVQFKEKTVQILDFTHWWVHVGEPKLNFITIDCEGMEWRILTEINLAFVGCEFLIIEWNGDKGLEKKFTEYCAHFGLEECGRNSENLMFCLKTMA